MRLCVLRTIDAAGLAGRVAASPWADAAIMPVEGRDRLRPLALVGSVNVLLEELPPIPPELPADRLVLWSGWLPSDAPAGRGVFRTGAETWMGEGMRRLEEVLPWLVDQLATSGVRLCIRPHARHVISDAQSCRRLLGAFEDLEILIDPAAMLTPEMLPAAEEHIERVVESLAGHERVVGVVAANAAAVRVGPKGEELLPLPLHKGSIDADLICGPIRRHLPEHRAAVLLEEELPQQLGLIRPAGRRL